jgi:hypothetical protein
VASCSRSCCRRCNRHSTSVTPCSRSACDADRRRTRRTRRISLHAFSAIIAGVTTLMVFRTVLVVTSLRLDSTLWGVSPPLLRPSH